MDIIYYDKFTNEYTRERDEIAPPERYLKTLRGTDGIYIETWVVNNNENTLLNVAYTEMDLELGMVNKIRRSMENENNCKLSYMLRWSIPQKLFDKYVEQFNLTTN